MNLYQLIDNVVAGNPALVFFSFVILLAAGLYTFLTTLDMILRYKLEKILIENSASEDERFGYGVEYMTEEEIRELED